MSGLALLDRRCPAANFMTGVWPCSLLLRSGIPCSYRSTLLATGTFLYGVDKGVDDGAVWVTIRSPHDKGMMA